MRGVCLIVSMFQECVVVVWPLMLDSSQKIGICSLTGKLSACSTELIDGNNLIELILSFTKGK